MHECFNDETVYGETTVDPMKVLFQFTDRKGRKVKWGEGLGEEKIYELGIELFGKYASETANLAQTYKQGLKQGLKQKCQR